ncbi:GMC oxidoreductase [Camillea tinctor]|nr:GMC oxidoreductase [Camillea tinctor]
MPKPRYFHGIVIVGGGTAGLVLANRLSEDPTQSILVLEAGSDLSEDIRVKAPALYQSLLGTDANWGFQTVPQPNLKGRSVDLHQGRTLGGTSAINGHIYESALGNHGWNQDALRKYYAKAYTFPSIDESSEKSLGVEGFMGSNNLSNGPVQLSFAGNMDHPIREAWAEAFRSQGHYMSCNPLQRTSDSDTLIGSFSCLSSINPETKERSFAVSAYYDPIKDRPNLDLLTNTVLATKEVIISAGVFQSPKILELSGIGDPRILTEYGIEPVKNLPVGENLQDHLICGTSFEVGKDLETLDDLIRQEPAAIERSMQEYLMSRTGPLTSIGMHTYAYLPVISKPGREAIDALLRDHLPPLGDLPSDIRAQMYYQLVKKTLISAQLPSAAYLSVVGQQILPVDPRSDSPAGPLPGKFITLGVMLSQPLSRGSVHIASSDPSVAPRIDPKYFSNPIDAEVMAQHMLYLDTIAKSSPLSKLFKQPLRRRDPAADLTTVDSAKNYVRTSAISMWHYAGTCAMLPEEKGGVVSNELKVHGVKGLRVVDSSAIPLISTANIQSTVYALAERAADLIKEEYGIQSGLV